MARKTISALPDAPTLAETSVLEVETNGVSRKVDLPHLRSALFPGGIPNLGPIQAQIDAGTQALAQLQDVYGTTLTAEQSRVASEAARVGAVVQRGLAETMAQAANQSEIEAGNSAYQAHSERVAAEVAKAGAVASASVASAQAAAATTKAAAASASQVLSADFANQSSSSAGVASNQAVLAGALVSAASSSIALAASVGMNRLNRNAAFGDWPGGSGTLPAKWADWGNAFFATREPGFVSPFAWRQNYLSGSGNSGILTSGFDDIGLKHAHNGYYVVDADLVLNSGDLRGTGLVFALRNAAVTATHYEYLNFYSSSDSSGSAPGLGVIGQRYQFSKLVQLYGLAAPDNLLLHLMMSWDGFGHGHVSKDITWHSCGIRPATSEEIRANTVLPGLQATVATNTSAIATQDGKLGAWMETVATAGGSSAAVRLRANSGGGTTTSSVELQAREIFLTDGSSPVPALTIAGGRAQFTGELLVGPTTGGRMQIAKNVLRVFDAGNVLRVQIGDLSI